MRFAKLLWVLILLFASSARAQDVYRDEALHWQIRLPGGWKSVPAMAAQATARMRSRAPDVKFSYVAAFKGPGHPYALVEFMPLPENSTDLKTLAAQLGAATDKGNADVESKFSDVIAKAELGKPVLERAKNRIVSRLRVTEQNGREVEAITASQLTKDGLLQVNCYAPADEFAAAQPDFQILIDSATIDAASLPSGNHLLRWTLLGAVGGGVLGGLYELIRRWRKKATAAVGAVGHGP
jgi:hypothetical protein